MRLKLFVLVLIIVAALFPTVARPTPAAAQTCAQVVNQTMNIGSLVFYSASAGELVTISVTHNQGGNISLVDSFGPVAPVIFNTSGSSVTVSFTSPGTGPRNTLVNGTAGTAKIVVSVGSCATGINDGRLCNWQYHAVYTYSDRIDVYGIWERKGYFVLRVTKEELEAVPGTDGVNTLVKSSDDGLVQVYRLGASNIFQVHAGVEFVRFTGLPGSNKVCGTVDLD